jgi:hypothetical protein
MVAALVNKIILILALKMSVPSVSIIVKHVLWVFLIFVKLVIRETSDLISLQLTISALA